MNNILPTRQQLINNFNNALDALRTDREYIKICEEIRDRLISRSLAGDRGEMRILVPYKYHSLMQVDLTEANLSYSIVYQDFEIRF